MTSRQTITLGELYLHRGRAGEVQVVPAEWVDASCTPRTRSRWDSIGIRLWLVEPDVAATAPACLGIRRTFVFRELDR